MKRKADAIEDAAEIQGYEEETINIGDTFFLDTPIQAESGVYNRSSAALPVPDALPADFAGVPSDGLQYLFMVRRETYATPRVKVAAANPYATVESSNNLQPQSAVTPGRPSESWKEAFIRRFKTMRETLGPESLDAPDVLEEHFYPLPGRDEPAWKTYIYGRTTTAKSSTSADNEAERQAKEELVRLKAQPKTPSRNLLKHVETPLLIELLNYFNEWMQAGLEVDVPSTTLVPRAMRKAMAAGKAQAPRAAPNAPPKEVLSVFTSSWILALLASLHSLLDADDVSNLRALARTCHRVIKELPTMTPAHSSSQAAIDSVKEQQSRSWMIIAAISDTWHQRDLWGL